MPEHFHLCLEGMTKMMIRRMFEDSKTNESKALLKRWDHDYMEMRVFHETPRATRNIETKKLKGSELGTVAYSAFPALIPLLRGRLRHHW